MIHVWLRATLPEVSVSGVSGGGFGIRWASNIGHNLIDLTWISFNDLKVQEFDSYWLDMWSSFTVPASKRNGYNNMIGNVSDLTTSIMVIEQTETLSWIWSIPLTNTQPV